MMKKDFIYYTDKDGFRAYAQDAPSIQAHTHTLTKVLILFLLENRIDKNVYKRMVDGQETTRYRTSKHCKMDIH